MFPTPLFHVTNTLLSAGSRFGLCNRPWLLSGLPGCVTWTACPATTKFSRPSSGLPAQLARAYTEIHRRLVVVQLYKALGGGRNLTDTQWRAADTMPPAQNPLTVKKP